MGGAKGSELEVIAELRHRGAQREEMATHVAYTITDLGLQCPRTLRSFASSGAATDPTRSCGVIVKALRIKRTSRGAFDAAGETPPPRSGLAHARPEIISVDQHTPVIDDVDHEHRRGLRLRQPHNLHLAAETPRKPLCQLCQSAHV